MLILSGVLLLLLLYPLHPLVDWPAIWRDPQQREHTIMAVAIVLAGVAELLRRSNLNWGMCGPLLCSLLAACFSRTPNMARPKQPPKQFGIDA